MKQLLRTTLTLGVAFALTLTTAVPAQAEPAPVPPIQKPTPAPKPKPKPKPRTNSSVSQGSSSNGNTKVTYTPQNKTYYANGVSFTMVEVRGGTFTMGATKEQGSDALFIEKPAHKVTLPSFNIGQTEVTQALWQAVMGNNPSYHKGNNNYPVEKVSWNDVQTFISKLNDITGLNFRLPTEAEWEFAARGGTMSKGYKYSGSNNISYVAWCGDNSGDATHPVGTKAPNELGIYDMTGNVSEWCQDWYGEYSSQSDYNPAGSMTGSNRVERGGSAWGRAWSCRVSYRNDYTPGSRYHSCGFRLAISNISNEINSNKYESSNISDDQNTKIDYTPQNKTFNVKGVTFTMIEVRGGTFTMGATPEQGNDADSDEKPTHKVTLPSYYIGQTEVTQALWKAIMGNNPSDHKGNNNYPVECVGWNDVQTFISKLNNITGLNFRLPTEAEWEFAARGGTMSQGYKYSGSNNISYVAWYYENSGQATHPVGTKASNELGIYDMSGNVKEWCQDWYGSYSSQSDYNPAGAGSGSDRVARGGGEWSNVWYCRVSDRCSISPDYRDCDLGFRLAI